MIKVIKGDITELPVDAVVNAANNRLRMVAGVAGAIKCKGGASIEEEAVAKGPIPMGEAIITGAGSLKADHVIHAVVVGQDFSTDADKVRIATRNALLQAEELGLRSVAFPALGTGVGGLGFDVVSQVMVCEARRHLACGSVLEKIVFVIYDETGFNEFSGIVRRNKIVCLGDSITYGFPFAPEMSWVRKCSDNLALELINKGINGDTTWQMYRRFIPDVVRLKPAYVIIMGGTNDAWMGSDMETIQRNIEAMVKEALGEGICPVLGLPVPQNFSQYEGFLPGDMSYVACVMDELRAWIREFADEQLLPVMDFYAPLINPSTGTANPAYFADDDHPNLDGYRVLAGAAKEVLLNLKKGI